ncbi:hypothetical protein IWQ60_008234 [Tieghemiomyces parasiticus]|uniref:Cytidyltransferase-like domain-containing protein n=1 Tax=Tieghemiomyces parasiticus TaxID=78921 RepID=A0A9W8A2J5_9FUNG|nr:hypothetical protein IWQ60_008234 [Tieghemiomyces parasiticus]
MSPSTDHGRHGLLLLRLPDLRCIDLGVLHGVLDVAITHTAASLHIVVQAPGLARQARADDPDAIGWTQLQEFLAILYGTATRTAARQNKFLFETDVLLQIPDLVADEGSWLRDLDQVFVAAKDRAHWKPFLDTVLGAYNLSIASASVPSFTDLPCPADPTGPAGFSQTCTLDIRSDARLYDVTVIGGTFDHLHSGHKLLLTMTVWATRSVLHCGLSDEPLLKNKKFRDQLEPYQRRCERVDGFLRKINPRLDYRIVPLLDPFGPSVQEPGMQAIVCSGETLAGAEAVNQERRKRNYPELALLVVNVISHESASGPGTDFSLKLSSTAIREYYHNHAPPA